MATQAAAVIPFEFHSTTIRAFTDDKDEPWFCAADVCRVLGYRNTSKALSDNCRKAGVTTSYISSSGQQRRASFINEGNLYRLIIKSRKEEAEEFEGWVCDEVLPTIRKTGSYQAETIGGETIGTDGLKILRELIGKKVRVLPHSARNSAQHRLWNLLHTRFNVPKAEMIAANDFDAAANFVGQWAIEGEYLERARPQAPETRKSQTLYYSLIALQHYLDRMSRTLPGEALTLEQRERYQARIDNCLQECIDLAKDPSRITESGEISTILRNLEGLAGRANALERDFVERVGPALKLLDSRLYGNWREHIGVLSRYLSTSRGRAPSGTLALN